MNRHALFAGVVLAATGCAGGDSTGPPTVPDLEDTYTGELSVLASSPVADQTLGPFPATARISQQKSNVSIVLVAPEGGAFTFSGTVAAGGAVTLDDEAGLAFLTQRFPACSFGGATTTSRALPSRGRLVLTADISGASCPWHEADGARTPTSFAVRFEGTS